MPLHLPRAGWTGKSPTHRLVWPARRSCSEQPTCRYSWETRDAGIETARAAISLADRSGAIVDFSVGHFPAATVALQQVGMVTATLGEIRQRADLVLFWGSDPTTTHPRHLERYSLPNGKPRKSLVIDSRQTETTGAVDRYVRIRPGSDAACFQVLRALLKGHSPTAARVKQDTGVAVEAWRELAGELGSATYGAMFLGEALATSRGGVADCQVAFQWIRELNDHTRFVCMVDWSRPASVTAEQVLTWQSGFPANVSFAAGYPRYGAWTAEQLLLDQQVDLAMLVGEDADHGLSAAARQRLTSIPCIAIGPGDHPAPFANVSLAAARNGIETHATWFRMDQVPLVAHPVLSSVIAQ